MTCSTDLSTSLPIHPFCPISTPPVLSTHPAVNPLTCQPVLLTTDHMLTTVGTRQSIFKSTPHLPDLHITCLVCLLTHQPVDLSSTPPLYLPVRAHLSRRPVNHPSSARYPHNLSCLLVTLSICRRVHMSASPSIHPSSAHSPHYMSCLLNNLSTHQIIKY